MPSQGEETVREIYARWAQGDFTAGVELWDDASVFVLSPEFPDSGVYVGRGQMGKYMHQFLEPWEQLTITCITLNTVGDSVVAEVRQEGKGEMSGATTGFNYFQVWSFRGGTLLRLENIMQREEAVRATAG